LCRAASERTVVRRRQRRCPCRNVPHFRSATMKTIKFEDALEDYLEEMKRTGWYTKAYKAFVEANILKLVMERRPVADPNATMMDLFDATEMTNSARRARDELATPIKKTRSHGTIAKRVGLAKRPRSAKGLPFYAPGSAAKGRCVTHSITSSARASSVGGSSMPSAFAVFRLMTNSYLVGACTGRSAGFSPLRMRST